MKHSKTSLFMAGICTIIILMICFFTPAVPMERISIALIEFNHGKLSYNLELKYPQSALPDYVRMGIYSVGEDTTWAVYRSVEPEPEEAQTGEVE